jgi:hypothetical protein
MADAVSTEYSFAYLLGLELGDRGHVNDADVFRLGQPQDLAKVLEAAADAIDRRTRALGLQQPTPPPGSPAARIDVGVSDLRGIAMNLKNRSGLEGETYQWHVIGALVGIIAAMLAHYEPA